MNKFEKYQEMRNALELQGISVYDYKEINYGLQFDIELDGMSSKVRIYESKKGIKVDLSTVKHEALKETILNINSMGSANGQTTSTKAGGSGIKSGFATDIFENPLIGVDESGKGDYFGPLVIAGVYADAALKVELQKIGAMDSKALSDKKIEELAEKIKKICPYNIVVIGNESYNKMYYKIDNLNKLLAWGHARVIENMLGQVDCPYALSDQFGNENFIKSALMEKGKKITLEQRPKGEENIVVAAASILARNEFVKKMEEMKAAYGMTFPKGAGAQTLMAARDFVKRYGKEELLKVSKLHFKTTKDI